MLQYQNRDDDVTISPDSPHTADESEAIKCSAVKQQLCDTGLWSSERMPSHDDNIFTFLATEGQLDK